MAEYEPASAYQPGDLVEVTGSTRYWSSGADAGTWRVAKVNPVNLKLERPDNPHVRLNCHPSFVRRVSSGALASPAPLTAALPQPAPRAGFPLGSLVRSSVPRMKGRLYVVLADKGEKVNVAQLGGADGLRYWRCPPSMLTRVDLADPLEQERVMYALGFAGLAHKIVVPGAAGQDGDLQREVQQRLSDAFDSVKNQQNWKLPVDAEIPPDADLNLISEAVSFFTGSLPEFIPLRTPDTGSDIAGYRVVAAGYYAAIGS